jgi:hypothetical protein
MIDTLTVPAEQFDLDGFLDAYREFHREWAGDETDADASVYVLARHGDVPMPYGGNNLTGDLLAGRKMIFFPLHEPLAGEEALCVDSETRRCDTFDIGVSQTYGFLLEYHDGLLSLHPALYEDDGPLPTLTVQGQCGGLDDCLAVFARRFVRQGLT